MKFLVLPNEFGHVKTCLRVSVQFHTNRAVQPQKMARGLKLQIKKVEGSYTGPDSSSGRASTLGAGSCGFDSQPHHTKGIKYGTSGYLAWCSA